MTPRCHACSGPLDGATVRLTFEGFTSRALNGATVVCHARCVRLEIPERDIALPERVSDPIAEPDLVSVEWYGDWIAKCRECGITVGIKDNAEDAHLAAARHIARVHAGVAA